MNIKRKLHMSGWIRISIRKMRVQATFHLGRWPLVLPQIVRHRERSRSQIVLFIHWMDCSNIDWIDCVDIGQQRHRRSITVNCIIGRVGNVHTKMLAIARTAMFVSVQNVMRSFTLSGTCWVRRGSWGENTACLDLRIGRNRVMQSISILHNMRSSNHNKLILYNHIII